MSDKRRGLGRGLGALIPTTPTGLSRPVDVFFPGAPVPADPGSADPGHAPSDGSSGEAGSETASNPAGEPQNSESQNSESRNSESHGSDARTTQTRAAESRAAEITNGSIGELQPVPGASYAEIPVHDIRPNPRQPRTVFDADDMAELVHSISEIGLLQPIVVRPLPEPVDGVSFELIMGERRWRAAQEAGFTAVPSIIKATEDDALLRDALLENLHRSQLNALEEAAAYQQLLEDFQCTQEELATRIGRSRPQVSNTLRLLKLPPLVARRIASGVLSAGHARALLALDDAAGMERLAQRIVAEGLSVRSVEEIVSLGGDESAPKPRKPRAGRLHPHLDDIAADVADRLDTRVGITLGQRKGKMTVEFASLEDLNRILDLLGLSESHNV